MRTPTPAFLPEATRERSSVVSTALQLALGVCCSLAKALAYGAASGTLAALAVGALGASLSTFGGCVAVACAVGMLVGAAS